MSFDISHLLAQWEYHPGQIMVRKFVGKDGLEKIQLRVDLGLLHMNAQGRPDGKRPAGHASFFDRLRAKLNGHLAQHDGDDEGFSITPDDCARLQLEALQYHHRSICYLQLEDFENAIRDTSRNLEAFDFVARYAQPEEMAWTLEQFRPQVLMNDARARACAKLKAKDFDGGLAAIEQGIERIREFYQEHARPELQDQSPEIYTLERFLEDTKAKRPRSRREQLESALAEAVNREDYEKAAEVRDELRKLNPAE